MRSRVFKGLTRPPMLLGVPMVVLMFITLTLIVLSCALMIFFKYGFVLLVLWFPLFYIARDITKNDDYAFNLLYLKALTRGNPKGNNIFKANTFIGEKYDKPSKHTKREYVNMGLEIWNIATYSKFIPYSSMLSDEIVMTKEGFFISTWEIKGIPFLTEDDEKLKMSSDRLDSIIRNFSEKPIIFYKHSVRRDAKDRINSHYDNYYLNEINNLYFNGIGQSNFKTNTYYLTLAYKLHENKKDKELFSKLSVQSKTDFINYHLSEMKGYILSISELLKEFNGKILSTYIKDSIKYSNQLSFYNFLLTNDWVEMKVTDTPIFNRMEDVLLSFKAGYGQITKNANKKFFKCIEIKNFGNELEIGYLDSLLCAECDYVVTQSFVCYGKKEATEIIKLQKKQLEATQTDAQTDLNYIEMAVDQLSSDDLSFGQYHFVLMVFGNSIEDVSKNAKETANILSGLGLLVVESIVAPEASFWSQFPTNFIYRPRKATLSSKNYTHLVGFHNLPTGKPHNNSWGDAVTLLKTTSGQPYYFNYHLSGGANKNDFGEKLVGHTLVLGASGTGKTALMNFLFNQARKFSNVDSFPKDAVRKQFLSIYFDKDKGALGNILASGGVYLSLKAGENTGFAPFKCDNNPLNVKFLIELIQLLVTRRGEQLSSQEETELDHAVKAVMSLPFDDRGRGITKLLSNIQSGKSEDDLKNSLSLRLRLWSKGGSYGWVFDNEDDLLDFNSSFIFGIDGTDFLDDKNVSAPIARYLVHKVYSVMDGRRGQLNIDETWKYVQDPILSKAMDDLLVTARKSDWFLVMGTQSPSQILRSDFKKSIIEQTETYILLPNEKADIDDYEEIGVTHREFELIKNLNPASRQFLIKKSNGSTLCELNLSVLGKYLKLISTGKSDIEYLENIQLMGTLPKDWIPLYLDMDL